MPETTTPVTAAPAGRFAASAQPLLVVDDDCVCVEASLGACRLLGCSRGEVVGRPVVDLLEADSRERFEHIWRAFREGGGQAEPFALDVPATVVRVGITVTAGVLPHRHLIRFDPPAGALPAVSEPLASPVAADNGAGPQVSPADPGGRRPTPREREVLGLLAGGATDGQVATMLELSPATVQTHVRNAKAKLGARTRAQAVALAIQRGLIDAP